MSRAPAEAEKNIKIVAGNYKNYFLLVSTFNLIMKHKTKLQKKFYTRNVHIVAKELLGKLFVRRIGREIISGIIVEVEAYDGSIDEAAHTFRGKTKRNEVTFEEGGLLYVYFTYGMHFCCNVVAGKANEGKAILLRAFEPVDGIDLMALNRFGEKNIKEKQLINLTNGPAKICEAFQISRAQNGTDLTGNEIFICNAPKVSKNKIVNSVRIGIKKSVDLPWRYYIKDNPFVSGKPPLRGKK
ncbi:MAG: DNA-3-methyladenine glycosylase [Bacteroidetes bacterium]|nr:DNA-3-methyladenine glycosylase [Bacteroidota bacterium]